MHHRTSNHNPAVYLAITGRTSERDQVQVGATANDWPHYGAVLAKLAPGSGTMPVSVQVLWGASMPLSTGDSTCRKWT